MRERMCAYNNERIKADNGVCSPTKAIEKREQRKEKGHKLDASCRDH